jgi:hypothetical protein
MYDTIEYDMMNASQLKPFPPFPADGRLPSTNSSPPNELFTWIDAAIRYPIMIIGFPVIYLANSMAGPNNGLGYQKFVAQCLIPQEKQLSYGSPNPTPECYESWKY